MLRAFRKEDTAAVLEIFNEVIEEGGSFPFEEPFDEEILLTVIASEKYAAVLEDEAGNIVGFYMLGQNYPGRVSSVANATYMIASKRRGEHLGEVLVRDSLEKAKELGYRIMQFNGVVDSNIGARKLYARVGFKEIGVLPKGFKVKDGHYEDMHIMYINL